MAGGAVKGGGGKVCFKVCNEVPSVDISRVTMRAMKGVRRGGRVSKTLVGLFAV